MSTQTLSRVTLETMANVRTAATQVVAASGAGTRRLVRAFDGTVQRQVLPVTQRLMPAAGERLDGVRDNVTRITLQGIDATVARGEQLIGLSSDFVVAQVTRISDLAAELDNATLAQGLDAAARLSLPAAQLALAVSGKVAVGATSLADAAGAHPVAAAVRKTVRKTSRQGGRAAKAVQTRVRKAAAKAPAVAKRARRAAA